MLTAIVIVVVSGALLVGAAWGVYGRLSDRTEGLLVASAGGALLVSALLELVDPATEVTSIWWVVLSILVGAGAFTVLDRFVNERWGSDSGAGLLAAITLDGIPENLALGVALIGARPLEVAALSGSILLSNLPEAAGGAREMSSDDRSATKIFGLWGATAVVLSVGRAGRKHLARIGIRGRACGRSMLRGGRGRRVLGDGGVPEGVRGGRLRGGVRSLRWLGHCATAPATRLMPATVTSAAQWRHADPRRAVDVPVGCRS